MKNSSRNDIHYVILRDDDTNAFTPVHCLERLYRPFLERGLPVNLAVIPEVCMRATQADGRPEGFLFNRKSSAAENAPIAGNGELVAYLRENPGYRILQHGCHHDYLEFDCPKPAEVVRRLEHGARRLVEAGFTRPRVFVAPYDRLSRASLREVASRFEVLSTGWFEWRRLPYSWWPKYVVKKLRQAPHWRIGRTLLLTHPGCLLSCHRTLSTMLGAIRQSLERQRLTVLVTHWWEYFREGKPDERFIDVLHETAGYLASHPSIRVLSFDELAARRIPLN